MKTKREQAIAELCHVADSKHKVITTATMFQPQEASDILARHGATFLDEGVKGCDNAYGTAPRTSGLVAEQIVHQPTCALFSNPSLTRLCCSCEWPSVTTGSIAARENRERMQKGAIWNADKKLIALAHRFYDGAQWTPKLGDFYCVTRAGLSLFQIAKWEGGKIWHRTIYNDLGEYATDWPLTEWDEAEFIKGGFMVNRVLVPEWAYKPRKSIEQSADEIRKQFGETLKVLDY